MRNLIHTISLAGGLLCTSLINAQGIFSTSELYKSTRSIGMGGITAVSAPQRIFHLRKCIVHCLLRSESRSRSHVQPLGQEFNQQYGAEQPAHQCCSLLFAGCR